jgi:hypothetical protein
MALPSDVVLWATDTNIATGSEAGTPTKVDPGAAYEAQGLVPGASFIGPYVNWALNNYSLHCQYLRNLHAETFFLGQNYTWTGVHTFTNTSLHRFYSGVQIDGSIVGGANISAQGQILAVTGNITAVAGSIVATAGDISAPLGTISTDDFQYSTFKTITRFMPIVGNEESTTKQFYKMPSGVVRCASPSAVYHVPIDIPDGAVITGATLRVICNSYSGGVSQTGFTLRRLLPSNGTHSTVGAVDASTMVDDTLTIGAVAELVDLSTNLYEAVITSAGGAGGGSPDDYLALTVTWEATKPEEV